MWNVYQYLKDFGNKKIPLKEFRDIYTRQKVLRDYAIDCYKDVIDNDLIKEYKKLKGVVFPYNNFKNLNDFILMTKEESVLVDSIKALMTIIDKIYK